MKSDFVDMPYPEDVSDIQFYVPADLQKSMNDSDPENGKLIIEGYATTDSVDQQNDIIPPHAIDTSLFLPDDPNVPGGHINYEHRQGGEYIIGYPTRDSFVDPNRGLFVKAELYPNMHYARAMWDLAESMVKSGSNQRLGYSIEGKCTARNKHDTRIVEKVQITNVALTTNPANPEATWETVVKSLTTGHAINSFDQTGAAALRTESLGRSIHNLSWTLGKLQEPDEFQSIFKNVSKFMDMNELNSVEAAVILLQVSQGISRKEARKIIGTYLEV